MPITKEDKEKIIKKFGKNKKDTGSSEVQVAILSHRISELTEHVKIHKKDKYNVKLGVIFIAFMLVCFSISGMCHGMSNKLNIRVAFGFSFFKTSDFS